MRQGRNSLHHDLVGNTHYLRHHTYTHNFFAPRCFTSNKRDQMGEWREEKGRICANQGRERQPKRAADHCYHCLEL